MYYSRIPKEDRETADGKIDTLKYPGQRGVTLEMCAGIVDKNAALEEVARMEALEECGYDVPLANFEHVKTYR